MSWVIKYKMSFKRPNPRKTSAVRREFVSVTENGSTTSYWVPISKQNRIVSGHPSVLGRVIDAMRNTHVPHHTPAEWKPSWDYEFIAKNMPEGEQAAYIAKSKAWFEAHPSSGQVGTARSPVWEYKHLAAHLPDGAKAAYLAKWSSIASSKFSIENINTEPIAKLFTKYRDQRPPIAEHIRALKEAGYPNEVLARVMQHSEWLEETEEVRGEIFDTIFARWPAANKADAKPKIKKVIKAVRKKL